MFIIKLSTEFYSIIESEIICKIKVFDLLLIKVFDEGINENDLRK